MLTDGAMGLKLGKVVHIITPHLHTNFESSNSYSSQNIPVEMHIDRTCREIIFLYTQYFLLNLLGLHTHSQFYHSLAGYYQ